jgi:protein TonB
MMGPGLGPGGAQLYPVAWLREPYDSELAPYLAAIKRIPPGASADIACRMAERNRVENCQIIGETPRGTGLAKALRLAAWQFLVKPPRIDNKPQLGVWVRIHFGFKARAIDEGTAPSD